MGIKRYAIGLVAAAVMAPAAASAQSSTLDIVKQRGFLNCQVGQPSPGFYALSSDGTWAGFDVGICRAVATAIFGDPQKVEFQSVTSQVRFTSLANGESDLLSRTTTWTITRDTQLGLTFTATTFYDGQGFMVRKDSGIRSALELDGATVCVATGTTTELNLTDYFRANNMQFTPKTFEDVNVLVSTFLSGGCDVYTNDKSSLASRRAAMPSPQDYVLLPETISKEPLGPMVRADDAAWFKLVRWVAFALMAAEEYGIDSQNVDEIKESTGNPEIRRFLGLEGNLNTGIGLEPDWAYNIVKMVGNYGELYEKYMGENTPIGVPREGTQNMLWTKGGLLYPPPFR